MVKAEEIRLQYFCVCEGQQEKMYLGRLSRLLKTDRRRVTFIIKQGLPGSILKQRSIRYDKAVLFDHDGNKEAFRKGLNACLRAKCDHAYSNLNFDLWLLLHKRNFTSCVSDNRAYVKNIRDAFMLDKEADIKNQKTLERILGQIELSDVKTAINRAQWIRDHKLPGDAERICTITCYKNPDLSIHEFIIKVLAECEESI